MVDFIEYVVAELKSKRLSKTNAAALVRQFSRRSSIPAPALASVIHPLLHRNTSDLGEQSYRSSFDGGEFFLANHQVKTPGQPGRKVLPGVAYLEMARAAIEQALPASREAALLELHDTVWAQPIVVDGKKQVSIVLFANDNDQIDYEICSGDGEREIVHCQGRAVFVSPPPPVRLDLDQVEKRMRQAQLGPDAVYATCARMGLAYGPAFQSIIVIKRGSGELLAHLRLPEAVAESASDYVLHPSQMDGALQAVVGLFEVGSETTQPRVPFALEMLRIVSPCVAEMVAWVRYAAGSKASDNVVKLDIDLCDARGNVCVQMHGFSSRILSQEIEPDAARKEARQSLLAVPVWETSDVERSAGGRDADYAEHHVILCELAKIDVEKLAALLPQGRLLSLHSSPVTIAQQYAAHAVACFEWIQEILGSKPRERVLLQIVVPQQQERTLFAGLSGLLKTAALENPQVAGQLIVVPVNTTAEELGRQLEAERLCAFEPLVRYEDGGRQVLRWQEIPADEHNPPVALRQDGVFLITGGLGGLGALFAKEILAQAGKSRVILAGRSALSPEKQARLNELWEERGRLNYRQVDLDDADQVRQLILAIKNEYGQLSGILHSAGMIADNFILKKSSAEFKEVLAPKVSGTFNLDQASRDVELDFFVLFSAIAGALGNAGQSDYAAANGFMDQFAAHRNRLVDSRQRYGRTLSIDWPLWQAGGMGIDPASQEMLQRTTGMRPMRTATGMDAFHRGLALACDQILVVEGDLTQIRRTLLRVPAPAQEHRAEPAEVAPAIDQENLAEKTQEYLRRQLSGLLKLPAHEIDPRSALENYGIDSILAMKLTNQLEITFGSLSKTLFFEYQTIRELTEYFVSRHSVRLQALLAQPGGRPIETGSGTAMVAPPAPAKLVSSRRFSRQHRPVTGSVTDAGLIAIIGLSGRYPESPDIDAYWENLRTGKDCIIEVPKERWDWREYFSEDRSKSGHHYSKWGGFIEGVDEFDPLFFNISPADAEYIDPQERLFLQHAWMAMEDAGYTRAGLQVPYEGDLPGQVGVYVGVMYTEYQLFGAEATARGRRLGIIGSAASISNRVSYALNLHGPSMTLDTMCSSSLTAIHIACQDLKQGRTSLAIAGGVNVTIHPNKYLVLSAGQFISGDGHCQSFGEGGDGYIPGEGVGAVVLKRLSEAKRDGDHIYGVIRGSALTHGGKTNGYSVPNPQAQTSAISRALSEAQVDPRHISYIEAHGTGTKLGDPIEIAALSNAFRQYTQDTEFCRIGSVKSNIGHCESAAGIAGLTKILLQMQHQQIVPSLHSADLNPHIDFPGSPFVVNQSTMTWEPPVVDGRQLSRIAGISSFGAGGSNAHILVEEYQPPAGAPMLSFANVVILLTAKTPEQLRQKALDLLAFIQPRQDAIDLVAMAYTLQVGREVMEERLGLVVSSMEQLVDKLQAWTAGGQGIEDVYQGQAKRNSETLSLFGNDADLRQTVDKWVAHQKFSKLLDLWVKGLEVDWSTLYGETKPPRVSLPAYPFARERYWIDIAAGTPWSSADASSVLHPLLHRNTSDFSEQRYSSLFTGEEFFLADHQVKAEGDTSQKVLPGVACLEMARAAIEQALPAHSESTSVVELVNTVWVRPIVISEKQQVSIALVPRDNGQIDYEIYTQEGETAIIHCQGRAIVHPASATAPLDLEMLELEMAEGVWEASRVYAACARLGLVYGPSFQGVTAVHQGNNQLLAHLRLPSVVEASASSYVLHPSLMDGALQAAVGLIGDSPAEASKARLPFALDTLRIVSPCTTEMVAWLRYAPGSRAEDPVVKLDIDLSDERGNVCVQMRGFSSRLAGTARHPAAGTLLATPMWKVSDVSETSRSADMEHHVILCELTRVDVRSLEPLLLHSHCLALTAEAGGTLARRYSECAVACFEQLKTLIQSARQGRSLVQVVVADHGELSVLSGLSGLLKTAALENPRLTGQLVLVPPSTTTAELSRILRDEKSNIRNALVRYEGGARQILEWQEITVEPGKPQPIAFKESAVYLITGGLGGLGLLFAREILEQTSEARVLLTGRSALSAGMQSRLDSLGAQPGRVSYRQLDLNDLDQVKHLLAAILYDYRQLDGILHSAGMIADGFILKKDSTAFRDVLMPKVAGTFNLDQASRLVELDFFVLFSSVAGALGNPGQADYAAANGFLDQFAAYRNLQVAAGERHGRTRSINWPLWQAGGMSIDPASRDLLRETTGIQPLQTANGMQAFHRILALPHDQVLVVEGDVARIRRGLLGAPALPAASRADLASATSAIDTESLAEKTQDYLRRQLSGLLKMPFQKIDPHAALEEYGIDSVLAMKLTNELEKTFGSLSKTLFFEYQTIRDLAEYFVDRHAPQLIALLAPSTKEEVEAMPAAVQPTPIASTKRISRRFSGMAHAASGAIADADSIAIIGLTGRYPESPDLQAYWENLRQGKDCITEVPKERWDWREYFSDDRSKAGHHYSKWGGFIDGVDEFDPLFFNMSPLEAELVDPQERLFLQHAWMAMEDAGYTRANLQVPDAQDLAGQAGVYVGVMYSEYQLFGAEASMRGNRLGVPGSPASIANRVSYALNLHGPSMTLDTMCSSSLTAIHVACLELKLGRTSLAIAGGVNVTIHPNKYLVLSSGQFISSDGHCQSFGEGGDGYIPGEGVGVVVLKRLSDAKRDGDHIYGVIRGSALNHGGKTNGYTVPNPQAQTGAIRRALAESRTDPRHISYIEAHGTGTKLGDPIEIAALSKAFHDQTQDTGFCLIGSVKSNIGHCESAAGIAGLTKVLLQMKHRQIVPSLHSTQLNPHIDFHATPFTVNQTLTPWEQPVVDGRTLPRIAGISSFGAGGSNAHIIVEEYQQPVRQATTVSKVVILLSARTPEQLRQRANDLLVFVQPRLESIDLAAVAYTLQVGREAMEERLGFVVSSAEKLAESLRAWLAGEHEIEDAYQGRVIRSNIALSLFSTDADLRQAMDKWIANRKLTRLLELWTYGMDLDWSGLYGEEKPIRVSLPTYPFARERYWIDTAAGGLASAGSVATAFLHPLLHSNTSDLREQRYSSTFTGAEFFLADHQVSVNGHAAQKVLPGVAQLEMARAAVEHASPADSESTVVELRNVVWAEPVIVAGRKQVSIALVANGDDEIDYEIYSEGPEREIVHGQGRAILGRRPAPAPIDLDQLMGAMHQGTLEPGAVYAACARQGLLYGSSFQGIIAIHRGNEQLLAQLRLPKSVEETSGDFVLHPSLMDSAVHACVGLIEDFAEAAGQPRVPFALDSLRMLSPCTTEMVAWVRYARDSHAGNGVVKLDIDLCDERGNVCVQMHGLSSRAMRKEVGGSAAVESFGSLFTVPVWQTSSVKASAERDFAEHHVIVCELSDVEARKLVSAAGGSECLFLQGESRKTIAERYSEYAVACFERIRMVLGGKPQGNVLVQIAVPDHQEQALFAGLSGLLKTAALENPLLVGQLLLLRAGVTAGELAGYLRDEKTLGLEPLVRYDQGNRQVMVWQDADDDRGDWPMALKSDGVYLLTGGLGALGLLFAREILERTSGARVVLTGRSELTAEKQTLLGALPDPAGRVSYRKMELNDPEEVRQVIAAVADEYHQLNGILHAAGMIADRFILKKSSAEFSHVLAPKVTGTFNLDQASQGIELDFFVLFSSVAGALGNPGQADYAAANGFLNQFAVYRNRLVAAGQRRGLSLSINWPLWQAGGMGIDPAGLELLQQTTGMHPMQTATGMQAFYRGLSLPYDQILVAEGDLTKMRRLLDAGRAIPPQPSSRPTAVAPFVFTDIAASGIGSGSLAEKTQEYLRRQFAGILKLPVHKIDPAAALEKYGIDSILAMKLTNQLETTFGSLSKTLFYEYQTIVGLAGYFVKAYPAIVREAVAFLDEKPAAVAGSSAVIEVKQPTPARRGKGRLVSPRTAHPQEIAIVGLAGRYPQAVTVQEFWRNLQNGRDCITEIPAERWDHSLYFDPDQNKTGKSYSKWGGFIDDVDKFDPLFFNISPKEAAMLDPQERLFLETAWQTIEDAGYTKENVAGGRVGVYVGVMWGHYQLFGAESLLGGNGSLASSSYASVANRVSYFFNFHGPSIALDTMCSSSITAIHLACDALRKGEIDAAIAGGVNVSIHPYKYVSLSQGKFAASDGRCRSFGAGGDGYVPGEGVGAVLLKPLEHALRDGDQIYAVIKSSAINHGGKTNGYTVPNPNAQGDVVTDALRKANIDPGTLSYIETHGTGTSLGDPIEITGLLKAFEGSSEEKQYCPIGSVKSNIGHLESAAGIASVTKALLQLKYQQLVPSLHADPLNPNINFESSPFYVQTELAQWKRTGVPPRRVGVSSFGAGGSNAHLILEEYAETREQTGVSEATSPEAFVLSARNSDTLLRYAESVADFLGDTSGASLADIAYTSQVGRTPMDARLAIIASSVEELREKLRHWAGGDNVSDQDDVFYANIREAHNIVGSLIAGPAGNAFLEALLAERDLERIARLWVSGACLDWPLTPRRAGTRRVSLPTYPFAKERYWIDQATPALRVVQPVTSSSLKAVAPRPAEKKRRTYYYPQWTPKPLAARTGAESATGPTLILDRSDGLFLAMREQEENAPFVLVKPGSSFQEIEPNVYTIDPEREDQFLALLAKLRSAGLLPRIILHHAADACDLQVREEVAERLNDGLYALFRLCKTLIRESHQGALKVLSVFSADSEGAAPLDAAIGGFFRTLTLEEPMFLAKGIEVDRELSLSARCGLIRDELRDHDWTDQEIRLRSDSRYVRRLVAHTPESSVSTLPLRANGVYLISGGLGGLGIIFAEHLAKNYQARLVLIGRSAPNAAQELKLEQLRSYGAEVLVLPADTSRLDEMEMVVREAKARFSEIHGVIHAAGVTRDAFLLRKTREEIEAVLAPKVYGTINVDLATADDNLDFLVLFSSVAGVMGNVGQSDYAYANHFLDSFAESRARKRAGRTLSINWPLWEEGGMGISPEDAARLEKQTGVSPLPAADGIQYWEDFLRSDATQGVALYGVASRIAASIARQPLKLHRNAPAQTERVDASVLLARTEAHLKMMIGEEINLAPDRIGSFDPLESFGLDSIVINRINARLERDLGALPKTLLYEHETVRDLAAFLVKETAEALTVLFGTEVPGEEAMPQATGIEEDDAVRAGISRAGERDDREPIAIIGIHGIYPHSANLAEYWENLKQGKDLIDLVPANRWDYEAFYHPDPAAAAEGKIYCKWGGFLDGHDKFDPHFFKIPTAEAGLIDPQERMFLESVWAAIEDAGYTRDSLRAHHPKAGSADVGVYVGVTTNSYHLWASEERARGSFVSPTALPWSIANRVSYFFDFSGPSLPIDTACSSSLVAIHLACESLRDLDCQVAIAGGVNLYLHPEKYHSLCQKRMLSVDGKCHSYGAGDDGFVPGEGVGTLVLKRLSKAIEDKDRIHAVIRASAFDHSGRSNGYSAPNPNAQANLISQTLAKAGVHPETIGYVEGHGTGTQLGDSIEIAALTKAFQKETVKKQFCPIGSVKANIGHSESAAGVAGIAKVILQMEHRQLAPSIYSEAVNPNIEFDESPFYLQHGLSAWQSSPAHPRRALVNSFGAGGVNACVVVEEYEKPASPDVRQEDGPWLFTLSARNEDRLREYAGLLLTRLRTGPPVDVASLCYTLQTGREAMEERLAIVVSDTHELIDRLVGWTEGSAADVQRGSLSPRRGSRRSLKLVRTEKSEQSLMELATKWVAGEDVDWESLYATAKPRRIGVPTYPFARERYWFSDSPVSQRPVLTIAHLHPLIAYNSSTLKEVNFRSSLPDTAFYAVDHEVHDERIFPGAGFLEIACIAANMAGDQRVRKITDIVWMRPLSFRTGPQALRTVLRHTHDSVEYVISSRDEENEEIVHSEGRLVFGNVPAGGARAEDSTPPEALKALCAKPEEGEACYDRFRSLGLHYGPSFRTIQELYANDLFALAKLKIPDHLKGEFGQFVLHPSIIDGALQSMAGLVGAQSPPALCLPFALDEIEIIGPIPQTCYAHVERADPHAPIHAGVTKFNIRILNERGEALIKFRSLYVRPLAEPRSGSHSAAAQSARKGRLLNLSAGASE